MRIFFGWWQVAVALILNAASSASIFTAYSVIAVPLEQTFEPSRTMLMMGVTVANLAAGALSPFAGAAIDRFSVRLLMFGGTVILGAGFALLSFTNSMSQVILVYLFLAVAAVLAGPMAAAALLARWFTRSRGLAMSLAASGGALGGLIIPPLLQFLIDTFEWRMALQIYGVALFLVTGPLVGLVITNRPSVRNLHPDGDREPPPSPAGGDHRKAGSILVFLRDRNFWLIALCLGMLFSGPVGLLSNLVPFALEKGITASQGALLLSIFSGANFVGKLASGPIADRVDFRLMLGGLMILMSLCFFGFLQSATFQLLALVTAVIGTCQGAIVPLWTIILARVYGPDNMGRSMGLMSVVIMPFTLVAAPFFGWSYDATGSYNTALITYTLAVLGTLAIVAMLRGDRPASVAAPT